MSRRSSDVKRLAKLQQTGSVGNILNLIMQLIVVGVMCALELEPRVHPMLPLNLIFRPERMPRRRIFLYEFRWEVNAYVSCEV